MSISGGQRPAVRVQANPNALSAYGLTLRRCAYSDCCMPTSMQPKGNFDGPRLAYTINSNDQLLTSDDYQPINYCLSKMVRPFV